MKKTLNTIGILGCGWLGLPLAHALAKNGMEVNGAVTTDEKRHSLRNDHFGIYTIKFSPELNSNADESFFNTDILFVNIPPGRKNLNSEHYLNINKNIIAEVKRHQIKKVIFIGSTSVYPEINDRVYEDNKLTPDRESGKTLLATENLYTNESSFETTIIRFGGLIGGERNPGRFLAGKTNVANGSSPINLIHLDDCLGLISLIIEKDCPTEIYNACMPHHPSKKEFYTNSAKKHNFTPPEFSDEKDGSFKIVDSSKIINSLGYRFKYQSPLDCF